jgi:hypothetical protein
MCVCVCVCANNRPVCFLVFWFLHSFPVLLHFFLRISLHLLSLLLTISLFAEGNAHGVGGVTGIEEGEVEAPHAAITRFTLHKRVYLPCIHIVSNRALLYLIHSDPHRHTCINSCTCNHRGATTSATISLKPAAVTGAMGAGMIGAMIVTVSGNYKQWLYLCIAIAAPRSAV